MWSFKSGASATADRSIGESGVKPVAQPETHGRSGDGQHHHGAAVSTASPTKPHGPHAGHASHAPSAAAHALAPAGSPQTRARALSSSNADDRLHVQSAQGRGRAGSSATTASASSATAAAASSSSAARTSSPASRQRAGSVNRRAQQIVAGATRTRSRSRTSSVASQEEAGRRSRSQSMQSPLPAPPPSDLDAEVVIAPPVPALSVPPPATGEPVARTPPRVSPAASSSSGGGVVEVAIGHVKPASRSPSGAKRADASGASDGAEAAGEHDPEVVQASQKIHETCKAWEAALVPATLAAGLGVSAVDADEVDDDAPASDVQAKLHAALTAILGRALQSSWPAGYRRGIPAELLASLGDHSLSLGVVRAISVGGVAAAADVTNVVHEVGAFVAQNLRTLCTAGTVNEVASRTAELFALSAKCADAVDRVERDLFAKAESASLRAALRGSELAAAISAERSIRVAERRMPNGVGAASAAAYDAYTRAVEAFLAAIGRLAVRSGACTAGELPSMDEVTLSIIFESAHHINSSPPLLACARFVDESFTALRAMLKAVAHLSEPLLSAADAVVFHRALEQFLWGFKTFDFLSENAEALTLATHACRGLDLADASRAVAADQLLAAVSTSKGDAVLMQLAAVAMCREPARTIRESPIADLLDDRKLADIVRGLGRMELGRLCAGLCADFAPSHMIGGSVAGEPMLLVQPASSRSAGSGGASPGIVVGFADLMHRTVGAARARLELRDKRALHNLAFAIVARVYPFARTPNVLTLPVRA